MIGVEVAVLAALQGLAVWYLQIEQAASGLERLAVLGFGLAASLAMTALVFRYQRTVIREERLMRTEDRAEADQVEHQLRAELAVMRTEMTALRVQHWKCAEVTNRLEGELAVVRRQMAEAIEGRPAERRTRAADPPVAD